MFLSCLCAYCRKISFQLIYINLYSAAVEVLLQAGLGTVWITGYIRM